MNNSPITGPAAPEERLRPRPTLWRNQITLTNLNRHRSHLSLFFRPNRRRFEAKRSCGHFRLAHRVKGLSEVVCQGRPSQRGSEEEPIQFASPSVAGSARTQGVSTEINPLSVRPSVRPSVPSTAGMGANQALHTKALKGAAHGAGRSRAQHRMSRATISRRIHAT